MKMGSCAVALWSVVAGLALGARAETFTTVDGGNELRVVDGWINDIGDSSLYIGKTTSGNRLEIINGGKVYDRSGILGETYQTTSHNNSAWVAGGGSAWHNSYLFLGKNGSDGNQVLVELQGAAYCDEWCEIGSRGTGNSLTVQGAGSEFRVGTKLEIGSFGNNNLLAVLNGGKFFTAASLWIGVSGTDNETLVSGAGAEILMSESNSLDVVVGGGGGNDVSSHNSRLRIENGGKVVDSVRGIVGFSLNTGWGIDSEAIVSGAGSTWSMSGVLSVGGIGRCSGGRLLVENGGLVESATAEIGTGYLSTNNAINITGEGSVWNNTGGLLIGTGHLGKGGNALRVRDSGTAILNSISMGYNSSIHSMDFLEVSGGVLSTKRIAATPNTRIALTNAVLRWRSPVEGVAFMSLGEELPLAGTNEIQIAVSSRSAMENRSLILMENLDDPSGTNFFEVLFLDTSVNQLYRPEGAIHTFETNSATWSITTDSGTEFVPTPPVPILSIEISGGYVDLDARYLPEAATLYLQSTTNLASDIWTNLYETSGTASTNWSLPLSPDPAAFYRIHSN